MANENAGALFRMHMDPSRVAVVDMRLPERPREITYGELDTNCDAVARALTAQGVARGARVGILAHNRVELLEAAFGAMRAGVIPVPLPTKYPKSALADIASDAGLQLVFTDAAHAEVCPDGPKVVDFDRDYQAFLDEGPFTTLTPDATDVALQSYTSGSTGRAKGVLLGHVGHAWLVALVARIRALGPRTTMLVAVPLHHMYGFLRAELTLFAGGMLVLQVPFDASRYIDAIERYRVTHLTGVATTYRRVIAEAERLAAMDVSSVISATMGASPFSQPLFDELARAFPNAALRNDFGITEAGTMVFGPHPDGVRGPHESPGHPLPGVEVQLRPGPDEGELYVRSPALMLGYHNLPDVTRERLQDGWLATGDIFRRDRDGFFYFVTRADDMFKCGGETVYPEAVEAILERHAHVRQAAVVSRKHEIKGNEPVAFVVLRPGTTATEDDIKTWVLAHGPAFLHPRRVIFVPELPLNANLKVDRRALGALEIIAKRE